MILKAKGIKKSFDIANQKKIQVLKGVDLEIQKGEFIALMGRSGAGKSTLLHILGSLDNPDKGDIQLSIEEKELVYSDLNQEGFNKLRNEYIGFVFQFHHLLPEFTAIENVMIPSLILGVSYKEAKIKAQELIDKVGLDEQKEQKPSQLSGGEQQRVAIARALINDPAIIFADEPTGNLDKENADSILSLIKDLQLQFNKTFVIATHSDDVANIAERKIRMSDGKLIN